MPDRQQLTQELTTARAEAQALLASLQAARSAPSSESDLFARVSGTSAIENAIANTRRMLDTYDRVLAQLRAGVGPASVEISAARLRAGAVA